MRQFYTMHVHLCTEIKACKKINKRSILTENTQTKQHNYQTKTCLVHKIPSGVAIMSHVCSIAAIVHHSQGKCNGLPRKCGETRNSCLLSVKYGLGVAT